LIVNGILLLYHHPLRRNAATIMEHVEAFERNSRFAVWKVNTEIGFPKNLAKLRFPIVILHYSLWAGMGYHLDEEYLAYLDASRSSYLVAFYQDEHHYCRKRFDFINDFGIRCIYTLLEPPYVPLVYGKYTKAEEVVYHIPGYVSRELIAKAERFRRPYERRKFDVGYRGRELAIYMGRGAREKGEIAREFQRRSRGTGLALDLGTKETRRLYGDDWYRFIGNCRGFLGVEAGVSVFDLEDVVRTEYERLMRAGKNRDFGDFERRLLPQWEDNVYYRTISPRHFEAAAFRTCQILYEGRYSEILEPMRHYIPLKKDFSNFGEVLERFRDRETRERILDVAYEDLIRSGRYSYERFIGEFDDRMLRMGFTSGVEEGVRLRVEEILRENRVSRTLVAAAKWVLETPFPGRPHLSKFYRTYINPRT